MAHRFDPIILREYDIRGKVDQNLSINDAVALGHAFAAFLIQALPHQKKITVCIGYDGRESSLSLAKALIESLINAGIHVHNIGLGPTPMLYFAVKNFKADAGIIVTGSHNPADYNGFKMTLYNHPVFGDDIQKIGLLTDHTLPQRPIGKEEKHDIKRIYINRLIKDLNCSENLTIGWDAGNGATGAVLRMLTDEIPGTHHILYDNVDGTFPNHHPDPTIDENLIDLQKLVRDKKCDLGIAFDGDGDRIGVVDENGNIIRCDTLMSIYARSVLKKNPGATIIGDVKCSQVMFDEIERLGGSPIMWKTGHSPIKDKMRETKAPLAGELSGHIFFGDIYYGFDDGLYCAIRLLNTMHEFNKSLSDFTATLPHVHNTPEIRFDVPEQEKFGIIPQIKKNIRKYNDININSTDGLRVTTKDGWWLIRPSNTQNAITARAESCSQNGLKRLLHMMGEELEKLGYTLPVS